MKKTLINLVAIAFAALMIANVYAQNGCEVPCPPTCCPCCPPGLTPGFWKHNIQVYLRLTNGKYSALPNGTKLSDTMMDVILGKIHAYAGGPQQSFVEFLEILKHQGWCPYRTNAANWFNWAVGLGPFVD